MQPVDEEVDCQLEQPGKVDSDFLLFCGEASGAVCNLRPNSPDGTFRLFAR